MFLTMIVECVDVFPLPLGWPFNGAWQRRLLEEMWVGNDIGLSMLKHFNKAYKFHQHWCLRKNTRVYCLKDNDRYYSRDEEASYFAIDKDPESGGVSLGFCQCYFRLGTLNHIFNDVHSGDSKHNLSVYENRANAWITVILRTK